MESSCCGKPATTIIRVADFDAGIVGLENAFISVSASGAERDEDLMNELLREARKLGNYISPSREDDYKKALLGEYRAYIAKTPTEPPATRKAR